MDPRNKTILITGGGSGIGFALAKRLADAGATVIVSGRRADALAEAVKLCPALKTLQGDVSTEAGRVQLAEEAVAKYPSLDVLVNNAGIQNRLPALTEPQDWSAHATELSTNLHAPMHLSMLLLPHLLKRPDAAIINVSSGLAFVTLAFMPTYCATKAALHAFTMGLRKQLEKTSVKTIEIVPPMVNTDLGGKGLHDAGTPLDVYADDAFAKLVAGDVEIGFGFSEKARRASREELDQIFATMNP